MLPVPFRRAQESSVPLCGESPLSRLKKIIPYLFIVIPCTFYFITACRTPGWVDATLIVSNVVNLELGSWVNCHNLFHVLGYAWIQLFPDLNIHFYLVLLSALLGALTVQLMFLVFLEITSSIPIAAAGAVALMVSHSLWWHSTMLEVYTLNSAILAAMLLFIVKFNKTERFMYLCVASFLMGLGCSNHVLMVLFVFGFIGIIIVLLHKRKGMSFSKILMLFGCFLLGAGLYLYVFASDYSHILRGYMSTAPDRSFIGVRIRALRQTMDITTGGEFRKFMFSRDIAPGERRFWRLNYLIIIIYNYPSAAILLALFGFYPFWKARAYRLTFLFYITGLIAQIIWSSNFFIWDMYAFSLPVHVLLSVPLVFSLRFLVKEIRVGRIVLLLLLTTFLVPPFIYHALSDDGCKEGLVKRYFRNYPEWEQAENTWDVVRYLTNPSKRSYTKVPEYVDWVCAVLPHEAHFWNSVGRADYPLRLYYRDIYGIRTDIRHHSLFNPFMSREEALNEALKMKACIEQGLPVYIASLAFPERLVLDQLYVLLDPEEDLERVSSLPLERFVASFPEVGFEKIVLVEDEGISIYRVTPRMQHSQAPLSPHGTHVRVGRKSPSGFCVTSETKNIEGGLT